MPDKPNHQELGQPVVGSETDPTEVYDRRYGTYQEQEPSVSPGAKPRDPQTPFKVGG